MRGLWLCFLRTSLIPLILLLATSIARAQSPCTPPDSMKPQLQGHPTATALADLGVWFANQKLYDCAADAFAVSLYFSGNNADAIAALQQAELLGYDNLKLHVILATVLDATHATKDAEAEWRKALAFDPELSSALDALSNDLLQDKDFAAVINALEKPRLLGQRTPAQCLNLAAAYTATQKPQQVLATLRDCFNTYPDSPEIANQLAALLTQLNRSDEAAAVLSTARARQKASAH